MHIDRVPEIARPAVDARGRSRAITATSAASEQGDERKYGEGKVDVLHGSSARLPQAVKTIKSLNAIQ